MVVHLLSPNNRYDMTYLRNYAVLNVKDRLARIDGVGHVQLFGAGDYSMRVWVDPQKAAEHGLAANDIVKAIQAQNVEAAAGVVGASPSVKGLDLQLSVNAEGRLSEHEEQFGDIVVKTGARRGDAAARRRAHRTRRIRVRPALAARQQAGGGDSDLPGARLQRTADLGQRPRDDGRIKKKMPEGVDFEAPRSENLQPDVTMLL